MKATFQIPDDLYRQVKARSALEGKPVKDVVISLFRNWLGHSETKGNPQAKDWKKFQPPLKHLVPKEIEDHSIDSIRESITQRFDEK